MFLQVETIDTRRPESMHCLSTVWTIQKGFLLQCPNPDLAEVMNRRRVERGGVGWHVSRLASVPNGGVWHIQNTAKVPRHCSWQGFTRLAYPTATQCQHFHSSVSQLTLVVRGKIRHVKCVDSQYDSLRPSDIYKSGGEILQSILAPAQAFRLGVYL